MLSLGFNFNWQIYKSIVYNQLITAIINARMGGTITVDVDFMALDRGLFIKLTPDFFDKVDSSSESYQSNSKPQTFYI